MKMCNVFVYAHVLAWCLVLGAPSVVVMAGCVLVCSTSGRGRKHCKQEMASQCKSVRHRPRSCAAHRLLPSVLLAVMMAGCVLVCRASGRGRIHCKQEVAANATLQAPSSKNAILRHNSNKADLSQIRIKSVPIMHVWA